MKFPRNTSARYYALTERGISGPPTIILFDDWEAAGDFVDASRDADGVVSCTLYNINSKREEAKARARAEKDWAGISFKPCPYCGRPLTGFDVQCYDDDGGFVERACIERGLFVEAIAISCECGGCKLIPACKVDWPEDGWRERFADAVNARAGAVQ